MKTIDFSTLSLQEALDLAILVEEEAAERYEDLAQQMEAHDSKPAAGFFRFMIANETKHGAELAAKRRSLFGDAATNVDRSMLWDVEAPEFENVRAFMTARQALGVALDAEEKAYQFFVGAIEHVKDPEARALFESLKDEEVHHRELVAKQLSALPEDPQIDIDDYVDEPNAQ